MVGHQNFQAQRLCCSHPLHAGDPIVHGDQYIGATGVHPLGDGRGQAIAIHHPARHDVADMLCAQQAQTPHGHGAGGGAIAVVIGHDAQALLLGDGIGQQAGRLRRAGELGRRDQLRQAIVQILRALHATGSKQAGQQGVYARLLKRPNGAGWDVSCEDVHGHKA